MDFEQLKKDMDQGTQGAWEHGKNPKGGYSNSMVVRPEGEFPHGEWVADCGPHTNPESCANARRIARVPQLERIALAAEALAKTLDAFIAQEVDYMDINNLGDPEQQHNVKWGRKAIAAYREATK